MKYGAFVSYSHRDTDLVKKIISIIKESCEIDVWFDNNLRGGENYFSVIANQIVENDYFIFIVSDSSVRSEWCLRELEFAASEKKHIIAVWLDNISISPRIKLIIQNTHYINWYSSDASVFSQAIAKAFRGELIGKTNISNSKEFDELIPNGKKYFLTNEQLNKIKKLLQDEANERFCECFLPENANLLGMAYEMGIGIEQDNKKALLYYKASMHENDPDGQYLYASLKYQLEPQSQEYLSDMAAAAENGSSIALVNMGDNYYYGENGFPTDINKAYEYFSRSAKANNVKAMYYVAYGYRRGEGLPQDCELAYIYALKAKSCGFPRAFRLLAFMYEDGDYVEKDYDKSLEFFEEAIKKGDYLSYCYKGWIYGELGQLDKKMSLYQKAKELADKNEIKSGLPYYRLAISYDDGIGVEQDFNLASELYLKAAERNHRSAKKYAVECILKASAIDVEAYLKKALELNCKGAAYELGKIEKYRAEKDAKLTPAAISYFEKGAESGDMDCVMELIHNYTFAFGKGRSKEDRPEAIKWFQFFFANVDEEYLNSWNDSSILSTYYYAYAIELDYDPDYNTPDREFVLYYFKKSLEECPLYLHTIAHFAVYGYLFPSESSSGLEVDIPHAEEVLALTYDYMDKYRKYLEKENPNEAYSEWQKTKDTMRRGYLFISECYKAGKHVIKDKLKAKKYEELGHNFQ